MSFQEAGFLLSVGFYVVEKALVVCVVVGLSRQPSPFPL